MPPVLPEKNIIYTGVTDVVFFSQPSLATSLPGHGKIFSYIKNFFLSHFACTPLPSVVNEPSSPSVAHVLLMSNPLKIFNTIVRFYTILMINLGKIFGVGYVGNRNKTVNKRVNINTIFIQETSGKISSPVRSFFKEFTRFLSFFGIAPNFTSLGHGVSSFVTRDIFHPLMLT